MRADTPIAVIGMACRFPKAPDPAALWQVVLQDQYAIAPMPPARFNRGRYYDAAIGAYGKSYSILGGLIEDHPFDPASLRLPPRVLESTDIAHLWSLGVAHATFRDAGYAPESLARKNVGVIIGHARGSMLTADMAFATAVEGLTDAVDRTPALSALSAQDRAVLKARVTAEIHGRYPRRTEDGGIGTMTSGLAGLISHTFELTGRHMVVDAACASSFAAADIGMRALAAGRLDLALVGGASYSQELSVVMFAQSRALSADGSFPFDRRANGFISSDGVGFVLLKRLDDALRDGDTIRALIRGIGGSCDGKGRALWAPRREGQVLAIERAYRSSGIDPDTIGLIEAHATSTPLGDLTEIEALEVCFSRRSKKQTLPIGAIKGNIGHCREAAGAAGLIKAILALEHATLPPTGNFREPSPGIPWSEVSTEVITAPRPWRANGGPRRAGVSAFGIGGLNYHLIVEEAPPKRRGIAVPAPIGGNDVAAAKMAGGPRPQSEARPIDIAIVGVGGKFPGAPTVGQFWENLLSGKEVMTDVPESRWSQSIYYQPDDRAPYRTYAKRGAFISGFEANWRRYKVPPKLVERNDPLQFMVLESALDALEDARIDLEKIDRERVGVLVGSVFGSDFTLELALAIRAAELAETVALEHLGRRDPELEREVVEAIRARLPSINEDSSGSFSSSTLASRTSKTLDLMGPAYAIDAACASSLASLEAACELLRSNAVDLAIYAGADRAMRVQRYEGYCQFYALSRGDRPKPFDAGADGFLPGEGAAVCVLERLEDAERNGHHVYAVIKGIGSSGNGERKTMHRPSALGLGTAIQRALAQSGVEPGAVSYIECHGAGTAVGDATEVEVIRDAFHPKSRAEPLLLGSVKSNVGHTQGAAGAIAVVKTALALDRGRIPPTLGFERPHPKHRFEDGLRVNRATEDFPRPARYAGISSMGLAGINYHAILEQPIAAASAFEVEGEKKSGGEPGARSLSLDGSTARALMRQDGFADFWLRVGPSVGGLLRGLWAAERARPGRTRGSIQPAAEDTPSKAIQTEILQLTGTAREIGRQHGEAMRAPIREVMQRYESFLGATGLALLAVPQAIDQVLSFFDRSSIEELQGLAEGSGIPFRNLVAYNLDAALFPAYVAGCTQAVRLAATNGGRMIHLVNEDSPLILHLGGVYPRVIQIRRRTDGPRPDVGTVLFSVAGQSAGPNGLNDRGISVTSTTLLDGVAPRGIPQGLPHPQLVKRIVEEAGSIEQTLLIASSTARVGRWSLLVSDADRDEAAYLEYDGRRVLFEQRRIAGRCITTNHARSGAAEGGAAPEHSLHRACRAEELLRLDSPLTVGAAKRALRDRIDRGRGGKQARHPTMNTVRRVDNVMSLVIEPNARRFHVTDRVIPPGFAGNDAARGAEEPRYIAFDYAARAAARPANRPPTSRPSDPARPPSGPALSQDSAPSRSATRVAPASPRASGPSPSRERAPSSSAPRVAPSPAWIARVGEVMRRHVIRAIEERRPQAVERVAPRCTVILGSGPRANAIAEALRARGGSVSLERELESAQARIAALGGARGVDGLGIVLPGAEDAPWSLDAGAWAERRRVFFAAPFALLQGWAPQRAVLGSAGVLFGVTGLGGGLGYENAGQGTSESGALLGLLKSIRRELFSGFSGTARTLVQVLDASSAEPPELVAESLLAELDAGSPRLEVGVLRGKRIRLAMAPQKAPAGGLDPPRPLPATWLITGGARGVTARIAERLSEAYQPAFHLLGKHRLHEPEALDAWRRLDAEGLFALKQSLLEKMRAGGRAPSPLAWRAECEAVDKSLEIDRTLRSLRAKGSEVHYHAVDVADRAALTVVLDRARASGSIEGLIHGAGVEIAKAFDKKTEAMFDQTVGGKVDGLVNLLHLTERDPITHLAGFSSVSGRFGGHGQTDYSLANEAMARILSAHRARRTDRRVAALSWPAFSEVGLAARPSARAFLEAAGQSFMTPAEGANHFARELLAGFPEREIVVCGKLDELDLDRLLVQEAELDRWGEVTSAVECAPLLGGPLLLEPGRMLFERTVRADEPFLEQHRMGPTPILPAVIVLEIMAEAARVSGRSAPGIWVEEIEILQPLKIAEGTSRVLRADLEGEELLLLAAVVRPDGVVLEPDHIYARARRRRADDHETIGEILERIGARPGPLPSDGELVRYPYPASPDPTPGSRAIYHGPALRCLDGVITGRDSGRARLVIPRVELLAPGTSAGAWELPASLIDGCLQAVGMLGRLLYEVVALPRSFGRVAASPRAREAVGERVTLEVRFRGKSVERLTADFALFAGDEPILAVERYSAGIVP